MIRETKNIATATFMSLISNEERRSKERVRTRSVLVMVLVLAPWLLASAGEEDT